MTGFVVQGHIWVKHTKMNVRIATLLFFSKSSEVIQQFVKGKLDE